MNEKENPAQMHKRRETTSYNRYLIYYAFDNQPKASATAETPAAQNSERQSQPKSTETKNV